MKIMRDNNIIHDEYLQIDDNTIAQKNKQSQKGDKRLLKHGALEELIKDRWYVGHGEVTYTDQVC